MEHLENSLLWDSDNKIIMIAQYVIVSSEIFWILLDRYETIDSHESCVF